MNRRSQARVRFLRWPEHAEERTWCRQNRVPRILLVDTGQQPPEPFDMYEDWVRPPISNEDLSVRVQTLVSRQQEYNRPQVDPHGSLSYHGKRLNISPTQVDLILCLVRSFSELVLRSALMSCLPGDGRSDSRNVLDLHMARLRRKLGPIGLTIRTVWGCGYVLEPHDVAAAVPDRRAV